MHVISICSLDFYTIRKIKKFWFDCFKCSNIAVIMAKPSWMGMNKLGGTGRIRENHLDIKAIELKLFTDMKSRTLLVGREKGLIYEWAKLFELEFVSSKRSESHPITSSQTTVFTGCDFNYFSRRRTARTTIKLHWKKCALQLRFTAFGESGHVGNLSSK